MSATERKLRTLLMTGLLGASALAACGEDDDPMTPRLPDADLDGGGAHDGGTIDGGTTPQMDGAVISPPPTASCPPEAQRATEIVSGSITTDRTWDCNKTYLLSNYVFVKGGATLTIKPGTIIKGDGSSALFITREGKIDAQGDARAPIVFTSIGTPGSRVSGGWQGLVLLGKAPLNISPAIDREFEGLPANNPDFRYGGSDEDHDCGTLRYVRVEFGGHELLPNQELNNLTLAACGTKTTLDYVQVHKGKDDGIEFFGGAPSVRHLVSTGNDDDSIDWDEGFRGRIQFVAIQQHDLSGAGDSNGIEASNRAMVFDAQPVANPRVYNVTMIGDNVATHQVRAILFKDGTRGELKNLLATGFASVGINVVTTQSADALRAAPPTLSVTNSLFFQIGAGGSTYFPAAGDATDNMADGELDEGAIFREPAWANKFDMDPLLPDPFNLAKPDWVPPADSPAASGGATPPNDGWFDSSATYIGAFAPGASDWTVGWTDYSSH